MIIIHFVNRRMIVLSYKEGFQIDIKNALIKKRSENLKDFVLRFENDDIENSIVYSDKPEDVINEIAGSFKYIEAAGGIVRNRKGEFLIIERLGKNDLPKGKVERGEQIEVAAKREIEEECGISNLEIIRPLNPTYHTYQLKGKLILKKTYWFDFLYEGNDDPIPQKEEDITKAQWINDTDMLPLLKNTYNSILEVFDQLK